MIRQDEPHDERHHGDDGDGAEDPQPQGRAGPGVLLLGRLADAEQAFRGRLSGLLLGGLGVFRLGGLGVLGLGVLRLGVLRLGGLGGLLVLGRLVGWGGLGLGGLLVLGLIYGLGGLGGLDRRR